MHQILIVAIFLVLVILFNWIPITHERIIIKYQFELTVIEYYANLWYIDELIIIINVYYLYIDKIIIHIIMYTIIIIVDFIYWKLM